MTDVKPSWLDDVKNGLGAAFFGLCLGGTYYLGNTIGFLSPNSGPMALAFGIAMIASPVALLIGLWLVIRGFAKFLFKHDASPSRADREGGAN